MDQILTAKGKDLKNKKLIVSVAIVALLFAMFGCITYFVHYEGSYPFYELVVSFPSFSDLLFLILRLAPYIIFVMYVLKFYKNIKASICIPAVLGLITFYKFFYYIMRIITGNTYYIFYLPFVVLLVLAIISVLKGSLKKEYIIIATVYGLLIELISMIQVISMFTGFGRYYLYAFTNLLNCLGSMCIYVAMLILVLKNKIPAILYISVDKERLDGGEMSPEQSLRTLKDKFDFGMISEEEYRAKRAEIINKL